MVVMAEAGMAAAPETANVAAPTSSDRFIGSPFLEAARLGGRCDESPSGPCER
jgi:hypothetical protein